MEAVALTGVNHTGRRQRHAWLHVHDGAPDTMNARSIRIQGRVVDRHGHRPLEGLRVEAWDADLLVDDFVGRAERTDADGRFEIVFEPAYFAGLFGEREPDLCFRVFAGATLVARTPVVLARLRAPRADEGERVVAVELAIEPPALASVPTPSGAGVLSGRVSESDGAPALQLRVQAWALEAGVRRPLGQALTDPEGRYAIDLGAAAGGPLEVLLEVSDPQGRAQGSATAVFRPQPGEALRGALDVVLNRPRPVVLPPGPGRFVAECHLELPPDDVVERTEFERFFRFNDTYGSLQDRLLRPPAGGGHGGSGGGSGSAGAQVPPPSADEPNPLDIRTLPLAFHLPFTQTWRLQGHSRGRLVKSIALVPGEEQTVEFFTWDRVRSALESTLNTELEQQTEASGTRRDAQDVSRDIARQTGFEMSTQGKVGFTVGVVDVDLQQNTLGKGSLSEAEKSTRSAIAEATTRATQRVRNSRTLKVTESRETGREERVTRKLRNPNAGRSLTVAFFEVLAHYEITTALQREAVRLVVLIPSAELSGIRHFEGRHVREHESALRLALMDRALAGGFDAARLLEARDRACAVLCSGCDCSGTTADTSDPNWTEVLLALRKAAGTAVTLLGRKLRFPFSIAQVESIVPSEKAAGAADIRAYLFEQSLRRNAPRLVQDLAALGVDPTGAVPPSAAQVQALHVALAVLPPEAVMKLRYDPVVDGLVWGQIRDAILATLPSGDPISLAINYGIACKRADDIKASCGGFASFDDGGLVGQLAAFSSYHDNWAKALDAARQADARQAELARIAKEEREARILESFGLRETAEARERLDALLAHLNDRRNLDHYRFAVWNERAGSTDAAVMGLALAGLLDPTPVGIVGDRLAVPVRMKGHFQAFVNGSMAELLDTVHEQVQRHVLPTAALHSEAVLGDCSCIEREARERDQLQTWRQALDNQAAALEVQRLAARLVATPPLLDRDGAAKCPPLDIHVSSTARAGEGG